MLKLEHIAWDLPDGEEIIRDIDITVGNQKMVVVTGPNGGRRGYHRRQCNRAGEKRNCLRVSAAGKIQGSDGTGSSGTVFRRSAGS